MGRRPARNTRVALVGLALAICLILLSPYTALALNNPDSLQILSVTAFRHLLETDDFLLVMHYNIHYNAGQPSIPASKTFLGRLMLQGGNQSAGSATPYPFYNDGYDEGSLSLYWPASTAPGWAGNHTVRLEGNPTKFTSPSSTTYSILSDDYVESTDQDEIRVELQDYILDIADDLETDWGMAGELYSYTQAGTVLSLVGEAYFVGVIPGLRNMCPDLFGLQILSPTVDPETFDQAQANKYTNRWAGTMIEDFVEGLGDFFGGVSGQLITTMGSVLALIAVVIFVIWRDQKATAGFLIGWPIIEIGTVAGFTSYSILGVVGFFAAGLIGYFLAFRHGSG